MVLPGGILLTRLVRSRSSLAGWPARDVMTSPGAIPAFAAGLSGSVSATRTPCSGLSRPRPSAISGLMDWTSIPIQPREMVPLSFSLSAMVLAVAAGMAKPMPTEPPVGENIALLTPMTLPVTSKVGPPELP